MSKFVDTQDTSALFGAVHWIEAVLLGPFATSIAILSIASVGFMMLSGRVDVRRGATVVLGCFVLFGAPLIAMGLREATGTATGGLVLRRPSANVPLPSQVSPPNSDPYAGAAVPRQ